MNTSKGPNPCPPPPPIPPHPAPRTVAVPVVVERDGAEKGKAPNPRPPPPPIPPHPAPRTVTVPAVVELDDAEKGKAPNPRPPPPPIPPHPAPRTVTVPVVVEQDGAGKGKAPNPRPPPPPIPPHPAPRATADTTTHSPPPIPPPSSLKTTLDGAGNAPRPPKPAPPPPQQAHDPSLGEEYRFLISRAGTKGLCVENDGEVEDEEEWITRDRELARGLLHEELQRRGWEWERFVDDVEAGKIQMKMGDCVLEATVYVPDAVDEKVSERDEVPQAESRKKARGGYMEIRSVDLWRERFATGGAVLQWLGARQKGRI